MNMGKGLVYYCVGGHRDYLQLVEESIQSLYANEWDFDIAILCDTYNVDHHRQLLKHHTNVIFCLTEGNPDVVTASMRKIEVFSLVQTLDDYDAVLYLDADIIATAPLDAVFDAIASNPHVLHVTPEQPATPESYASPYFTNREGRLLKELDPLGDGLFWCMDISGPFNAGTFGFVPSNEMKGHFEMILQDIKTWNGAYFWEQSFMNDHFLRHQNAVQATFASPRVHIPNHGGLLADFDPEKTWFTHFANAAIPWQKKLQTMKDFAAQNANFTRFTARKRNLGRPWLT